MACSPSTGLFYRRQGHAQMIIDLNHDNLSIIKNPHLRSYAAIYTRINDDFMAQIGRMGLEVDPRSYAQEVRGRKEALRQGPAVVRNGDKSVFLNWLSPACEACRMGIGHRYLLHLAAVPSRLLLLLQRQPGRLRLLHGSTPAMSSTSCARSPMAGCGLTTLP